MKTDVLILDGNNLAHRSYHSMARLNNKGKPVSIIYGLPNLVGSMIKKFKPKRVYLVWDGEKSKIRLGLCPDYKGHRAYNRNFDPEDFYKQRDKVMEVFHTLGVKQLHNIKYEADDVIYMLAKRFEDRRVIIASNDKDFHQLISDTVRIYNASGDILTPSNLYEKKAYNPSSCVDYLCLVGDNSDNIKGYPGIGEVRGKQFLKEHSSIENFLSSNKTHKGIDKEKLEQLYATNRQLIDLAYYNKLHMAKAKLKFFKDDKQPEINKPALFKICDEYHILSFRKLQFLRIWE